jgi:hypothetical protein
MSLGSLISEDLGQRNCHGEDMYRCDYRDFDEQIVEVLLLSPFQRSWCFYFVLPRNVCSLCINLGIFSLKQKLVSSDSGVIDTRQSAE